jgi:hypothetical protein
MNRFAISSRCRDPIVIDCTLMRRTQSPTLFVALLLLIFFEREAKAYADPGSGALLWQILVAGFVGSLFYVRRAFNWLRGKSRRSQED